MVGRLALLEIEESDVRSTSASLPIQRRNRHHGANQDVPLRQFADRFFAKNKQKLAVWLF
jgi:hypothetical protein